MCAHTILFCKCARYALTFTPEMGTGRSISIVSVMAQGHWPIMQKQMDGQKVFWLHLKDAINSRSNRLPSINKTQHTTNVDRLSPPHYLGVERRSPHVRLVGVYIVSIDEHAHAV